LVFYFMAQPLEVLADLRLVVDGEGIDIRADGDRIVVDLSSLEAGRRLLEAEPLARDRSRTVRRAGEVLEAMNLTAELRLNGSPFARLGAGIHPGNLGRIFGLPGVELEPSQPIRAAVRRRPLLAVAVLTGLILLVGIVLVRYVRL
jgi:hypothetical protein